MAEASIRVNRFRGTRKIVRLFNPRVDAWGEHFHWEGAVLTGKTAIGRVTVQVLNINRADSLLLRECLIREPTWFE